MFRDLGFGFRVSDFGFRVSGFGFRVSGFGSNVDVDEVARVDVALARRRKDVLHQLQCLLARPDARCFMSEVLVYSYREGWWQDVGCLVRIIIRLEAQGPCKDL